MIFNYWFVVTGKTVLIIESKIETDDVHQDLKYCDMLPWM